MSSITACRRRGGVRFLTWHRDDVAAVGDAAAHAVIEAAAREGDLVVLDLPRRLDEVTRTALRLADRILLVVPAEVRAAAAAGRLAAEVETLTGDLRIVVRGPAPTGLAAEAVADALDLPLAGRLRAEPGLAAALDRGLIPPIRPRGPLATFCRHLTADVRVA